MDYVDDALVSAFALTPSVDSIDPLFKLPMTAFTKRQVLCGGEDGSGEQQLTQSKGLNAHCGTDTHSAGVCLGCDYRYILIWYSV
jgi:hypothetical protein